MSSGSQNVVHRPRGYVRLQLFLIATLSIDVCTDGSIAMMGKTAGVLAQVKAVAPNREEKKS